MRNKNGNCAIEDFNGDAVVIGCTHKKGYCHHPENHDNVDEFYTIDSDPSCAPDRVLDLAQSVPMELIGRFKLCILEKLPYFVYNQSTGVGEAHKHPFAGFNNALEMLSDDGFLIIDGCPRRQEFRQSLVTSNLRYFELTKGSSVIIIPKNQQLTAVQLQQQCDDFPCFSTLILQLAKTRNGGKKTNWFECHLPLDEMECLIKSEAFISNRQAIAMIKASQIRYSSLSALYNQIEKMRDYGIGLNEVDFVKSQLVIKLAEALENELNALSCQLRQGELSFHQLNTFKSEFNTLLHSKDSAMNAHRKIWNPIIANILIAMTGVGLVALTIKVGVSSTVCLVKKEPVTFNKLFFFAKTNSQHCIEKIEDASFCVMSSIDASA